MATATQTQATSPLRKRFPHIPPPRAVASIIASRRRASTADLKARTNAPEQPRAVSTPVVAEKSETDSDPEAEASHGASSAAKAASGRHQLSFSHAADIFVRLRRVQKKVKAHHIDSKSGDEPVTNRSLLPANDETDVTKRLARLEIQDVYVCSDAVDVAKLLRASRAVLLDRASPLHANVLVDEQWACSICGPKHRSDGSFRVHIRYAATAATSPKHDPRQPVALEKVSGVPGLMTITNRETVGLSVVELYEDVQNAQS